MQSSNNQNPLPLGMGSIKIILVYKKSLYTIKVIEKEVTHFSKDQVANLKEAHDANEASIQTTEAVLEQLNVQYKKTYRASVYKNSSPDLVVAVGGDGTFMEASRIVNGQSLILGVNSDPKTSFGYYCRANSDNVFEAIRAVINGESLIGSTKRLVLKIDGVLFDFPAMNDILIHDSCPAGLTRYVIDDGVNSEEHFCSGTWVSTPTGCSGAMSSVGGPKDFDFLGYQTVGLNGSKKGSYAMDRGTTESLTFRSKMYDGMVYVDGKHGGRFEFPFNSELIVSAGDPIKIVQGFPV